MSEWSGEKKNRGTAGVGGGVFETAGVGWTWKGVEATEVSSNLKEDLEYLGYPCLG